MSQLTVEIVNNRFFAEDPADKLPELNDDRIDMVVTAPRALILKRHLTRRKRQAAHKSLQTKTEYAIIGLQKNSRGQGERISQM